MIKKVTALPAAQVRDKQCKVDFWFSDDLSKWQGRTQPNHQHKKHRERRMNL